MKPRANVNLDQDAYDTATMYAAARGLALGAAISELIRRAEQSSDVSIRVSSRLKTDEYGFLVVPADGGIPLTPEMVKEAMEDELD